MLDGGWLDGPVGGRDFSISLRAQCGPMFAASEHSPGNAVGDFIPVNADGADGLMGWWAGAAGAAGADGAGDSIRLFRRGTGDRRHAIAVIESSSR
jgi:hypothetical protein